MKIKLLFATIAGACLFSSLVHAQPSAQHPELRPRSIVDSTRVNRLVGALPQPASIDFFSEAIRDVNPGTARDFLRRNLGRTFTSGWQTVFVESDTTIRYQYPGINPFSISVYSGEIYPDRMVLSHCAGSFMLTQDMINSGISPVGAPGIGPYTGGNNFSLCGGGDNGGGIE